MQLITQSQLRHYSMRHPEESATIEAVEHFLTQADLSKCRDKVMGSAWIFNPNSGEILISYCNRTQAWIPVRTPIDTHSTERIQTTICAQVSKALDYADLSLISDNIFNITIYYDTQSETTPCYQHDFCFLYSTTNTKIPSCPKNQQQVQWRSIAQVLQRTIPIHTSTDKKMAAGL